jgi:hypothetical protein
VDCDFKVGFFLGCVAGGFKFFYQKEVFNFHNVGGGPVMTYVRHMNTLWTPSVLVVELWWAKEDVSFKD